MRYALRTTPRPGVQSLTIKSSLPHNYVSTFTVVDFDAVERWKPGTIPIVAEAFSAWQAIDRSRLPVFSGQFENHVLRGKGLLRQHSACPRFLWR
jgi:hypothetical protein